MREIEVCGWDDSVVRPITRAPDSALLDLVSGRLDLVGSDQGVPDIAGVARAVAAAILRERAQ